MMAPAPGEGMTREQFSVALRLIAAAQVLLTGFCLEQQTHAEKQMVQYQKSSHSVHVALCQCEHLLR